MERHQYCIYAAPILLAVSTFVGCKPPADPALPAVEPPHVDQHETRGGQRAFDDTGERRIANASAYYEGRKISDPNQAKQILSEINSTPLSWNEENIQLTTNKLQQFIKLHATASASGSYEGFVLASECEWRLVRRIVEGCLKNKMEIKDAAKAIQGLRDNRMRNSVIAGLIEERLPNSATAMKVSEDLRNGGLRSAAEASHILLKDQNLDILGMSSNIVEIIDSPNIARAVQYYAANTWNLVGATGILQYISDGGDVSQDEKELLADIPRRLPTFFDGTSSVTGKQMEPEDLVYLIKRWRKER